MSIAEELTHKEARLRESTGWLAYERARAAILPMLDNMVESGAAPSDYWAEEIAGFEYLFAATPLIIEELRSHSHHITGLFSYQYRAHHAALKQALYETRYRQLKALDPGDHFVPEAAELGGFGFAIEAGLANIDTLKFYEAMVAMARSKLLPSGPTRTRVVEIGSGWGGLARCFVRNVPNCAYLLVDLPQTMLFSATYLQTLFPDKRFLFVDTAEKAAELADADYDFAFLPHYLATETSIARPDLALNTASFQEMSAEQVAGYGAWLARSGCRDLYSLNRPKSPYNDALESVRAALAPDYTGSEIVMLESPYTAVEKVAKKNKPPKKTDKSYEHLHFQLQG